VRLTPAGKRAFDAMTPIHEGWVAAMLSRLDRTEMAQLHALLGKLKQAVAASPETPLAAPPAAKPRRAARRDRS